MNIDVSLLAVVVMLLLAIWLVLRIFSTSPHSGDEQRRNLEARRMAQQPWDIDGAGGRANR